MILIKGDQVAFASSNARPDASGALKPDLFLPPRYGMIHDPNGDQLPKCEVFFGPYRRAQGAPVMTREAKRYFGSNYTPTSVAVDRPKESWDLVAHVVMIFYVRGRRGGRAPGGYHHPFKGAPLTLEKSGRFYRLSLPGNCIVDDRGFVFP